MPAKSPFTGINLSEQTATHTGERDRGRDSRLFAPPAPDIMPTPKGEEKKDSVNQEIEIAAKEEKKTPERQKVNYRLTEDAIFAVVQMRTDLRRHHRIKANLEDIVEAAIHMLSEDFAASGDRSRIVRALGEKKKS